MSLLSHEITAPLWEACIKIFLSAEGIFIWSQTDSMLGTTLKSTVPQKTLNSIVSEYDFPGYIVLEICACIFE